MSIKKLTKEQESILRQALFVPCDSKEHLHQWIKVYLGLDMPDCIVCDDDEKNPPSNSSPMDLIWEIYQKARDGKDHTFTQILGFAARDAGKTLSAAVMETLCIFHLKRDVGHMAALESQAKNCQRYIEGFLKRPILREFVTSKNKRIVEVTRYENQETGEIISPVQWQEIKGPEKDEYEEKINWMKIVIATVDDANGLHVPFFVCIGGKEKLILQTPEDNSRVNRLLPASRLFKRIAKDQKVGDFDCIIKPQREFKVKSLNTTTWKYEYKNILAAKRSTAFLHAWIIFEDNEEFQCTRDHLFFTKNGYKKAQDLTDQDEVVFENRKFYEWKIKTPVLLTAPQLKGYDGNRCSKCRRVFTLMIRDTQEYICEEPFCLAVKFGRLRFKKVKNVNLYKKEERVYDFTIEDNHNYLASSYIVHNCDELDLADPAAFEESKMIPTMNKEGGELPITFLTSTRKYSFGLVQKEINNAHVSNLKIRHWNIIDITRPCPPQRHLPNEPKVPIYYSLKTLKSISESDWNLLADKEKEQYEVKEGFAGCLSQCKLFAQCSGRLATKQTSKSNLLKPIEHVQALFDKVSVDHAKAQLLCWLPSSEGLIYPNFSRQIHMLTANQIIEKITGEPVKYTLTKANLIRILQDMQAHIYSGLDWGFTHNFAVVTAASANHNLFIFDCISVKELETEQKIELCNQKIKYLHPVIYPDSAYPADITTFKRHGYKMMSFKKDILGGIEATRARFAPANGQEPSLYLLKDDPGCELLASLIVQYHWKIDNQGNLTDNPDKSKEDDLLDALRYLCQNVTLNKTAMVADFGLKQIAGPQYTRTSWVNDILTELNQEEGSDPILGGNESDIQFII